MKEVRYLNEIMNFGYENGETLECIELDGEPLFNPASVGGCLSIGEPTMKSYISQLNENQRIKIKDLPEETKIILKIKKGNPSFLITESGLYYLIFKSRKPEAQKFVSWVTDDVLPSIRKTGKYGTELQTQNNITKQLLDSMVKNFEQLTGVKAEEFARVQNESYRAKLANLMNDVSKREQIGTRSLYEKLYFLFAGETGFHIPELAKKSKITNSTYLKQHELSAKMLYEFALAYFYQDIRVVDLIKLSPDQSTLAEF
jgi:prophage antirepressor-like protein